MFRLLAILVAVNLSLAVNGAPHSVEENGVIKTGEHDADRQDVISDERRGEQKDAFTVEEGNKAINAHEKITAGLKPRTLGDDTESTASMLNKLGQNMTQKFKKMAVKASDYVKPTVNNLFSAPDIPTKLNVNWEPWTKTNRRTRGKKNAQIETTEERNATVEVDDEEDEPSSLKESSKTSPSGPSDRFLKNEILRYEIQSAEDQVKVVRVLLSNSGADPYNDEKLAQMVDSALNLYHVVFNRPLPKLGKAKRTRITVKLAELERIFEEMDGRKGAGKASRFTEASHEDAKVPGNLDEELSEIVALGKKQEAAAKVVRAAKAALDDPKADPVNDEELNQLVDLAIDRYNKAHGRPLFIYKGLVDKAARLKLKLDEFQQIYDDLKTRNKGLKDL